MFQLSIIIIVIFSSLKVTESNVSNKLTDRELEIVFQILKTGSCHTYNVTDLTTYVRKFCSTSLFRKYSPLPTIPPRVNRVRGTYTYNVTIVIWALFGIVIGGCCKFYRSCKEAHDNHEIQLELNQLNADYNLIAHPSPIPSIPPSPSVSPPKYYDFDEPPPEYLAPPTYNESLRTYRRNVRKIDYFFNERRPLHPTRMEKDKFDIFLLQFLFTVLLFLMAITGLQCLLYCCDSFEQPLLFRKITQRLYYLFPIFRQATPPEVEKAASRHNITFTEDTTNLSGETSFSPEIELAISHTSMTAMSSTPFHIDTPLVLLPSRASRQIIDALPPEYKPPPAYNECVVSIGDFQM
ncbi:unnamed protein product [Orchesella dallaii]|uniref:Uncharacterized protein n=1 Tax=Orchesella dallaii TaxID=48710 RepID=A0ABP1S8Q5_9HEXA